MEAMSGFSLADVVVHRNSAEPAKLGAAAFTKGNQIHLAPRQERHLAHEAWHVVQQAQGRVRTTTQMKGVAVNGDSVLEREADAMGARAAAHSADTMSPSGARCAPLRGVGQPEAPIQRKTIAVAGGDFRDDLIGQGYKAYNEREDDIRGSFLKVGAQMELAFIPRPSLQAKEVSLVQTTNSTVHNVTNPHVPDQRESLLDQRRTHGGSAIDQQIYLKKPADQQIWQSALLRAQFATMAASGAIAETNLLLADLLAYFTNGAGSANGAVPTFGPKSPTSIKTKLTKARGAEGGDGAPATLRNGIAEVFRIIEAQTKSVNLDPRYSEERSSANAPLKAPRAIGQERGSGGWTAVKQGNVWATNAALRDQPGHKIALNDQVVGSEHFETAAMADGTEFVGSIRWGFRIEGGRAVLDPPAIERVNAGSASGEFFAAAEAWNAMAVPDPVTGLAHRTMQLPTLASMKRVKVSRRLTMWVTAALKRYPNAQQEHFDALTDEQIGDYLLTGKIAAWESNLEAASTQENEPVMARTVNDLLEAYPQGDQYLGSLTAAQLGEFVVSGEIAAWERM